MPKRTDNNSYKGNSKENLSPNTPSRFIRMEDEPCPMKYWYNRESKKAICLIDVKNEEAFNRLKHFGAQEDLPIEIVEVNNESFARIVGHLEKSEPAGYKKQEGFVLCRRMSPEPLELEQRKQFSQLMDNFNQKTKDIVTSHGGYWLRSSNDYLMVYFNKLIDTMNCALALCRVFNDCRSKVTFCKVSMNIGISIDVANRSNVQPSKESIQKARRLSYINNNFIVISYLLKEHFQSKKFDSPDKIKIRTLTYSEEKFINKLMDCLEEKWQDDNFQVEDIGKQLNCSKSTIYRQMMDLIGQSPNQFIREYRLNRSIDLIRSKRSNISDIAFESGFGSPSYFSHCFQKRFGLKPTDFMQITDA